MDFGIRFRKLSRPKPPNQDYWVGQVAVDIEWLARDYSHVHQVEVYRMRVACQVENAPHLGAAILHRFCNRVRVAPAKERSPGDVDAGRLIGPQHLDQTAVFIEVFVQSEVTR